MRQIIACIGATFLLATNPAMAEQTNASAPPATMQLENGELTGDGAQLLLSRLPSAQFILIGEDHGFAAPPEIALALAKAARPYGVTHHAAEFGPYTDEILTDFLRTRDAAELGEFLSGRALSMPFVNMAEDAALADYFIDMADEDADPVWGVDQEFIGSPLLLLEALQASAETDAAAALVSGLLTAEQEAFATGDQGAMFMFSATPEIFSSLKDSFAGNTDALGLIGALEDSAEIYSLYGQGRNFDSNTTRIAYMREHFLAAYRASGDTAPRALFRFGAIHLGRGTTFLNTFDLGSLTEGIAAANGLEVLRIAIMPLAGKVTQVKLGPEGFFNTVDHRSDDIAGLLKALGISEDEIPLDGYAVIQLAPVRSSLGQDGLNALSPEEKFFVLGYDYLVTTRGARPATPLTLR